MYDFNKAALDRFTQYATILNTLEITCDAGLFIDVFRELPHSVQELEAVRAFLHDGRHQHAHLIALRTVGGWFLREALITQRFLKRYLKNQPTALALLIDAERFAAACETCGRLGDIFGLCNGFIDPESFRLMRHKYAKARTYLFAKLQLTPEQIKKGREWDRDLFEPYKSR